MQHEIQIKKGDIYPSFGNRFFRERNLSFGNIAGKKSLFRRGIFFYIVYIPFVRCVYVLCYELALAVFALHFIQLIFSLLNLCCLNTQGMNIK